MLDWIPWAGSAVLLALMAWAATILFHGGEHAGHHEIFVEASAEQTLRSRAARRRQMEGFYKASHTVLGLATVGALIAMLVAWAVVE